MENQGEDSGHHNFGAIIAMIGAILIGMGFAWIVALNWNDIPSALKILILVGVTVGAYGAGILLRIKDFEKIGGSLLTLGALLYTLSIFLIAQIFSTSVSIQGVAFLMLLAFAGVVSFSYIFDSSPSLVIGLIWFLSWIRLQYWALAVEGGSGGMESLVLIIPFVGGRGASFGLLAILYLTIGILSYGLNLIHQSRDHKFSMVYKWWTVFYFLVFAYILSFQMLLPMIWPSGFSAPTLSILFLVVFSLIALAVFFGGVLLALNKKKVEGKEILAFVGIVFLLLIVIFSAGLVSSTLGTCNLKSCYNIEAQNECNTIDLPTQVCDWNNERCNQMGCRSYDEESSCEGASAKLGCVWENNRCNKNYDKNTPDTSREQCLKYNNERKSCLSEDTCNWRAQYYSRGDTPLNLWVIWIIDNIIFIFVILITIGYGIKTGSTKIVNLGIAFFVLDIITRYIGFIIDFGGQMGFAVMSILGGILLIFGGLGVEMLRRKLIIETKDHNPSTKEIN